MPFALARAAAPVQKRPVVLAPVAPVVGTWQTPIAVDPSEVPIEDKIALLLKTNEAALGVKGVRFVNSSLAVLREEKTLATTDGTFTVQTFHRIGPQFTATAIASGDFQTYSHEIAARRGWEYRDGPRHGASRARVGRHRGREALGAQRDPWLVGSHPGTHESLVDHSREHRAPDGARSRDGLRGQLCGTSFIAPPDRHIGKLRYGRELMNVRADRTQAQSLARCAGRRGVPADEWLLVEKGLFKDYQTTREQAAWIAKLTSVTRSHGCAFADSWGSVTFQRMPNVSLLPGEQAIGLDEIVAATERGIVVRNRGSWSIDHQRAATSSSGQVFHEVRGGKITAVLKDVAYQARTPSSGTAWT